MQKLGAALLQLTLLLLLLPQLAHARAQPAIQLPDYSLYKRRTDLLKDVGDVVAANPKTMSSQTLSAQDGDYKADVLVVTVEPGGLSTSHSGKVRLLLDFGEHGREFISSEVGLRFLQLLGSSDKLEAAAGGARRAARLRRILNACVFKILPLENARGRELVESGRLCERKNGRGVDTNRNWGVDWGVKEKDYDPSEEYPGRAPLSEPEVQVILGVAKALKPHVWLNVHSGMYALFTPYDHKATIPDGEGAQASLRIMQRINDVSCKGKCAVGSGGKSVGYLAHGTATDYMYDVLKVPLSFTWEIYGDNTASFEDCFKMFNPVTPEAFKETVDAWVTALLQLIDLLPTHPATAPLLRQAAAEPAAAEPLPQQPSGAAQAAAATGAVAVSRQGRNAEAAVLTPEAGPEGGGSGGGGGSSGGGGGGGEAPEAGQPLRAHVRPPQLRAPAAGRRLAGAQLAAPLLLMAVALGGMAWGTRADEWKRLPERRGSDPV